MKKLTILLAVAASAFTLASCNGKDEPVKPVTELVKNVSGGTSEEQEAIQTAVKKSIAQVSGSTTMLIGDTTYDLLGDNGDYLSLATTFNTKVTSGKRYDVNIEWDFGNSSFVDKVYDSDASHKMVEFNYPGQDGTSGSYTFGIKKISCGGASSSDTEVSYKCNVVKHSYKYYDVNISQLNAVHDIGGGQLYYEIADETDPNHDYIKSQPENVGKTEKYDKCYYVSCVGKVIYTSPDGNWGLLADGDHFMELFAGSEKNLNTKRFPAIANKYVKVIGHMDKYYGNLQISFITQIKEASASDLAFGEPDMTSYREITDTMIKGIKNEFGGHKQCIAEVELGNSLAKMTGTYVPNSYAEGSNGRFTYKIQVGTEKVTVAYDYHVDDANKTISNQVKAMIDSADAFEVKGCLRYCGDDTHNFAQTEAIPGEWQIVPFLSGHVAKK